MRKALGELFRHVALYGLWRGMRIVYLKSQRRKGTARISSPLTAGAVHVRPGTSDMAIYDQAILKPYLPMRRRLHTVLDLGANIGITVRYWKAHWPEARVVAVEPDPRNFAMLQRNTEGITGVEVVQAAIWPTPGRLALLSEGVPSSSVRTTDDTPHTDAMVNAVTVPMLMERFGLERISLLKIDIEGAELELFSMAPTDWLARVDAVAIELHDHWKPGCGDAFFRAMDPWDWNYSVHGEMIFCERRHP